MITSVDARHKLEAAEVADALRRRTTRNFPLAGFYLTLAVYFVIATYSIGTVKIGSHHFVPVGGLVTFGLGLVFMYAAARKLFVRTSDKAVKVLIAALMDADIKAVATKPGDTQAAHQKIQAKTNQPATRAQA